MILPETLQEAMEDTEGRAPASPAVTAAFAAVATRCWAILPGYLQAIAAAARAGTVASGMEARGSGRRGGGSTAGGVAVLSLSGVIRPHGSLFEMLFGMGSGGLDGFRENFAQAIGDGDISAVVLNIDSPGGLTDLVPETAAEVRAGRDVKPVIAVANTMAASAAYYIASQADEVVVTPSGSVGSIGVYTIHDDWSKFNEKLGVIPTYITAGKYKAEANPDQPLSADAKKALQSDVNEFYDQFVGDVAKGRGVSAEDVRSGYGEGRVLTARRAVKEGLADHVMTLEEAISRAASGQVERRGQVRQSAADTAPTTGGAEQPATLTVDELFSDTYLKTVRELAR